MFGRNRQLQREIVERGSVRGAIPRDSSFAFTAHEFLSEPSTVEFKNEEQSKGLADIAAADRIVRFLSAVGKLSFFQKLQEDLRASDRVLFCVATCRTGEQPKSPIRLVLEFGGEGFQVAVSSTRPREPDLLEKKHGVDFRSHECVRNIVSKSGAGIFKFNPFEKRYPISECLIPFVQNGVTEKFIANNLRLAIMQKVGEPSPDLQEFDIFVAQYL